MAETLLQFQQPVIGPGGAAYEARACGSEMPGGMWQGWIEFVPLEGGDPIRSRRETTQPNRTDTEYWATGLTAVYLEGALQRALEQPEAFAVPPPPVSVFPGPAPAPIVSDVPTSILDPFSLYENSGALLRRRLGALSAWHLVNIAVEYELTDLDVETLNRIPVVELIELIVRGVERELNRSHPA